MEMHLNAKNVLNRLFISESERIETIADKFRKIETCTWWYADLENNTY